MGFGSFVGAAEDVFDPNRAAPAGTDPARIHEWFHAGPGTGSYQRAAEALRPVAGNVRNYPNHLIQAQQALATARPGPATDVAQQALGQLRAAAQQIAAHAEALHANLTAQIHQFNDTKAKVVPVPAVAPTGPGLARYVGMIAPTGGADSVSADEAVAAYQRDARGNQHAYRAYQRPTANQASALPQGTQLPLPPRDVPQAHRPPARPPAHRPPAQPPAHRPPAPPPVNRPLAPPPVNGALTPPRHPVNGYGAPGPNGPAVYMPPKATAVPPMNSYRDGPGFGPAGGFGPTGPSTSGYRSSAAPTAVELAGERGMAELRSGRRPQDRDNKSALLQENNTDDLFGTDEKTVPPVIGG